MSNEIITQNISPALAQIMSQETPKEAIRTRPGRGGRVLLYTDGAYVIRTLNEAFNFNWDFEADHEEILWIGDRPFEARCRGKLVIRAGDTTITKMQFGCQPIEMLKDGTAPVSLGDAFKGAATDALKKCASLLGIALDLYDSDSEINTTNPQQVQRDIQQAKQVAKSPVAVEQPKTNGQAAQTEPKSAKPYKFPNQASKQFYDTVQIATDNYYESPFQLIAVIGNWFNFGDKELWDEKLSIASDHARMRRAEKLSKLITEDDGSIDPKSGMPFGAK